MTNAHLFTIDLELPQVFLEAVSHIESSTQQHPIRPLLLRHIRKPDARRMLLPRRQYPPNIQIPHVNLLIALAFLITIQTALEHFQLRISIRRQKERQRIPLLARFVPHTMNSGREFAVRLLLEILSDVTYKRARLRRRVDPDAILVEDFERGDGVLEDEG